MADYIPSDDAGLATFASNFMNKVTIHKVALGLPPVMETDMQAVRDNFVDALALHNEAQLTSKQRRQTKDDERSALVSKIRQITKQLQANPAISDAIRLDFGITVPDLTPTAVPAPTTRPVLSTDTSNRLQIGVKFTDESSPFSNAKPSGVDAMELYMKIGDVAPASIADCQFVGNARKTPYIVNFDSADGGKKVHFLANWITRSGLRGAVSELTSTTIVA